MSQTSLTPAMQARQAARAGSGQYTEMGRPAPADLNLGTPLQNAVDQMRADGYITMAEADASKDPSKRALDTWTGKDADGKRINTVRYHGGGGIQFQMPSATGLRRMTADGVHAFDIPVTVTRPDGTSTEGTVRLAGSHYSWASIGIGFDTDSDRTAIAEGVASVLETRKPSLALKDAGNLLDAHRLRALKTGALPTYVDSEWIASMGREAENQVMVVKLKSGRMYGYQGVSAYTFSQVTHAYSPGRSYNELVKHRAATVPVHECSICQRIYVADGHVCPPAAPPVAPFAMRRLQFGNRA